MGEDDRGGSVTTEQSGERVMSDMRCNPFGNRLLALPLADAQVPDPLPTVVLAADSMRVAKALSWR